MSDIVYISKSRIERREGPPESPTCPASHSRSYTASMGQLPNITKLILRN